MNAFSSLQNANDAYGDDGRLLELTRLVDACERLQAAGVDIEQLMRMGKRPQNAQVRRSARSRAHSSTRLLQSADDGDFVFFMRCRKEAHAHFFNFAPADENFAVVYCKLYASATESSSLREKIAAVRYIGERRTTRAKRAYVNNDHVL